MAENIFLKVLRHGRAAHNLGSESEHRFAGSEIDSPLAPEGREFARQLAEEIAETGGCDLVIATTLARSRETADIIAQKLGVAVKVIPGFEEINVGDFSDHTEAEVREKYPESAQNFYQGDIREWSFPNGEDYAAINQRVDQFVSDLKRDIAPGSHAVLVGHGMINRVLFYKVLPGSGDLWKERTYPHDRIVQLEI